MSAPIDDLLARMPEIARAVNAFESPAVQELAFAALLELAGVPQPLAQTSKGIAQEEPTSSRKRKPAKKSAAKASQPSGTVTPKPKSSSSKKQTFTLMKDLDFYSADPKLAQFAAEKGPKSVIEKCVLLVYWFVHHGGPTPVTIDMVYTGFKDREWPVPSDLANTLQQAGSKGLLNSGDRQNLVLTTKGENLIDHDLPRQTG